MINIYFSSSRPFYRKYKSVPLYTEVKWCQGLWKTDKLNDEDRNLFKTKQSFENILNSKIFLPNNES